MVQSIDQVQFSRRKNDNWDKARGRYNLINPPPPGAVNRGKKGQAWVQGGTENLETILQDPTVDNHSGLTKYAVVQLPLAVQREMIHRKPQEIVKIWDDSMEVTSEQDTMNPGQTSSKGLGKETDKIDNERCQSAKKHEVEKDKTSASGSADEYERLLLGTSDKGFVDISAESSSRSEKFVKGKEGESGKGGKRQLRKKSEDVAPDESEKASNEETGDASQSEKEDCNNANGSNLEIGECISKMVSDSEVDPPQDMNEKSSSICKDSSAVETMERVDKSNSVIGSKNKENPGVFTNESEKGSENPGKIAFKLNPEKAGSSTDKGKINLKWNKGGKDKLGTNLLAFEETESDEDETEGGDSKNDRQEKVQSQEEKVKSRGKGKSQQGKGTSTGMRRGSEKPSRWSQSRSSSGN